ncbi:calcium-binding protein [Phaeobacter italicus]|uniref:calcium-binding protein n=1 Tax=Phaeobacter italicus TaxID=481446 RepID=UPI001CD47295|nr:calcium-binding protein [Phaeobacter italicus]MCA0856673.1 hypothetical protein [Phaeobacter italicus]
MTTFTFSGARVDFVDGDPSSVSNIEAQVTVPDANSTFSYSIIGRDDDGVALIDMNDDVLQAIAGGVNLDNYGFNVLSDETLITQVTWSGGTSVVLVVSLETGNNTDTEFYFVISGAALPNVNSPADWNAFDASISGLTDPTGALAPGQTIAWSSLATTGSTEEDDFWGTPDDDTFSGGAGDDYFNSSMGDDTYNGGRSSYDQVSFAFDPGGVTANLRDGIATDGWGDTDTLNSIEMLRGSAFNDTLIGNSKRNILRGVEGEDTINGLKGRDEVRYDRDARYGGEDGVTVNLGKGFAIDGFGDRDTLRKIEDVKGTDFRDKIFGSRGRNDLEGEGGGDRLSGLAGNDTLWGGAGRDTLIGGSGDDRLNGGSQADVFVFRGDFGNDVIDDFSTGGRREKIDVSDVTTIRKFFDLRTNHLSQNDDGDAVISDGNGNTITLDGVAMADLSANDFIF